MAYDRSRPPAAAAPSGAPDDPAESRMPTAPPCPFCDGRETELMNAFGSHASVSTYWCRRCRSPFEMFRWRGRRESGG